MGPVANALSWSVYTQSFGGFIIGIFFGYFLEQGGFGNAKKLAYTFYFKDMTVVKVMFSAIVTAMIGIVVLIHYGLLDENALWLNPTYIWPGIAGAVLMGFGFAIGGYCPGTSVVGCATLKIDAFYNVGGSLLGMFFFSEIFSWVEKFYYSGFMGNRITLQEYFGIQPGIIAFFVILMAIALFVGSEFAEKYFGDIIDIKKGDSNEHK